MKNTQELKERQVGYFSILLTSITLSYLLGTLSNAQKSGDIIASLLEGFYFAIEWLVPLAILSLATKFITSLFDKKLSYISKLIVTIIVFTILVISYNAMIQGALELARNRH